MNSKIEKPDPKWGDSSAMHDPLILSNFRARPTDVLITTAPKAGTTWMQQILHQLRSSGGDETFTSIDDVVPWLERPRSGRNWQEMLQHYDSLADPRVFKTHCTAEQTPGIGTARIILTSRDPRDCCVSFYYHLINMTEESRSQADIPCPESFDQHVDQWLEFAAWYRNIKSWWPYHKHPRVLWLRYQDMKQDIETSFDQIIDFLQWQVSPDQRQKALEYSSFEWMKNHDQKFSNQGDSGKPVFKPGQFIRQGKTGGYRQMMSESQQQRILDKADEMLEPECRQFIGLTA